MSQHTNTYTTSEILPPHAPKKLRYRSLQETTVCLEWNS